MAPFQQQVGGGHHPPVRGRDQRGVVAGAEQNGRSLGRGSGYPVDQSEFADLAQRLPEGPFAHAASLVPWWPPFAQLAAP